MGDILQLGAMTMSGQIEHWNNEAVKLLVSGEHVPAARMLQRAIDSLRTSIEEESLLPLDSSVLNSGYLTKVYISPNSSNEDVAASPHNSFRFDARAILMNRHHSSHGALDETSILMVLLFNLAITHHHKSLLVGGKAEKMLTTALGLYRMILSLADEPSEHAEQGSEMYEEVLLLAVFSNMGHIYSHFFLTEEANDCRRQLHTLLARYRGSARSVLNDDEFVMFFLNADSFPIRFRTAPAA